MLRYLKEPQIRKLKLRKSITLSVCRNEPQIEFDINIVQKSLLKTESLNGLSRISIEKLVAKGGRKKNLSL